MEAESSSRGDPSLSRPERGGRELPRADKLWQLLLHEIDRHVNVAVWQPLDRALVVKHLQMLHRVGERPSYEEFKAYLDELWPAWPRARERVRDVWRTILRDPYHRFRVQPGQVSLATLDRLATRLSREYGSPPLDWRVLEVFAQAEDRFASVTLEDPELEAFLSAQRDLRVAMRTMARLRELRLGHRSTGNWIDLSGEPASAKEVGEWNRLRRRYARDW